ncbi:MAG: hypothetical protein FWD61_04695 [Phycisphaerales bacterium]|nr:hypothetical protein [Phycisphaerales bacterium]
MQSIPLLAAFSNPTIATVVGIAVAIMIAAYFAIRFWLISARSSTIKGIPTPNLDRRNRHALEHMTDETLDDSEAERQDEDPPDDLKAAAPKSN